jgi:hypothetical protein
MPAYGLVEFTDGAMNNLSSPDLIQQALHGDFPPKRR